MPSPKALRSLQPLLDILAILAWAAVLLKFWLSGEINVLLHPDYIWLAYSAGFFLLALGIIRVVQGVVRISARLSKRRDRSRPVADPQHTPVLPSGWGSGLLLAVAILGLVFTPQPFTSQMALDRGVADTLTMTRSQPQSFRGGSRPENRSLIDWIRTLAIYPEPDAYTGQKANIDGFIIHPPDLPDSYLMISRFVITCCAADAYPVALPVKLTGNRSAYPPDQWFRVEGTMMTETLNDRRQLVIEAKNLTEIPKPANPYDS